MLKEAGRQSGAWIDCRVVTRSRGAGVEWNKKPAGKEDIQLPREQAVGMLLHGGIEMTPDDSRRPRGG